MRGIRASIVAFGLALCLAGLPSLGLAQASGTPPPSTTAWTAPFKPFKITDGLYYVGSEDLAAYLITTSQGDFLLDGGVAQNAAMEIDNIRALGFEPKKVRVILNSHAHLDHAGALAGLKQATGAKIYASPADAEVIERGGKADFAFGDTAQFPPAKVDVRLKDGQSIRLGGVAMTPHFTPGHTKGCTSWSATFKVDGVPRQALFVCSVSALPQFNLAGDPNYPTQVADFEATFAKLKRLPCELFLGPHGNFYNMAAKRERQKAGGPNPFIDPAGCKAYIDTGEANFRRKLAADRAAKG
jgi:metallo-beta-lactamase class B